MKWYGLFKQTISFQINKGYPPQILLGPFFLNTLTQIVLALPSIHKLLKNLTNNN